MTVLLAISAVALAATAYRLYQWRAMAMAWRKEALEWHAMSQTWQKTAEDWKRRSG